ncbi:related to mutanase [Ramularia collo-cygni]|uniref:Related to mutanase n=1 Tax=Ramularia collo-cygni TaxID=112498 RepID=A0A2D3UX81_9PEZI|nr:related to mutanase [Ramularia collo-cygni]CZT16887.1 related to mutanase [Ramularia collo-cygni]
MFSFIQLCQLAAVLPTLTSAQNVFAHVVMGVTGGYTVDKWISDIQLAQNHGIEAFALNIAPPFEGTTATQVSNAFTAANDLAGQLSSDFKLFFSFDYLGGGIPWTSGEIVNVLNDYGKNGAHFQVDGKPMVSTFEGTRDEDINSWPGIRSSVRDTIGDIYLVPDWDSRGPNGFDISLVDGTFSWNMWANGPINKTTDNDYAWKNAAESAGGKSYMMGISPWFYTDLPQFHKAWVWRGDSMWSDRWNQALEVKPRFIEIVTWNDFGESHYIGPIDESSIVSGANRYVDNMPHTAWLQTLSYQIAAYKHAYNPDYAAAAASVGSGDEKIVYWYRTTPAAAGSTDATGNDCPSAINTGGYQTCYDTSQILEDEVFAIVMASKAATATIRIGDSTSMYRVGAGINSISKPFNGATGRVSVSLDGVVSGSGVEIVSSPADGVANYNAWVGCAGSCI